MMKFRRLLGWLKARRSRTKLKVLAKLTKKTGNDMVLHSKKMSLPVFVCLETVYSLK